MTSYNVISTEELTCDVGQSDTYSYSGDIVIPETVSNGEKEYKVIAIMDHAFNECSQLQSITIPKSIERIGKNAFYCCYPCSVNISDLSAWCKIDFDGYGVYANPTCSGYSRMYLNGEELVDVVIPSDVTEIKDFTFFAYCNLKSVTFHDNISSIGREAFYECSLEELHLPAGLKNIGEGAFDSCSKLTELELPANLEEIGDYAFEKCTGLTKVSIPKSLQKIGMRAFVGCDNLKTVNIEDISAWCGIKFSMDGSVYSSTSNPLYYAKNLYINNRLVENLVIPEGVGEISDNCFVNCSSLHSVSFPLSISYIGNSSFSGCSNINSIDIKNLKSWIEDVQILCAPSTSSYDLYLNGALITNLTIPAGVKKIGDYTFSKCKSISSVIFPLGLEEIGESAFSSCENISVLDFPEGVTKLGRLSFAWCSGLTKVSIPNSMSEIGVGTFTLCSSLSEVHIKDLSAWCQIQFGNVNSNPVYYAQSLYLNGNKLTDIIIPSTLLSR